jgi:glycosyltransferase involved in cell wall biosynthesis
VSEPRVLIVHDYLIQRGGAERVVDALLNVYPNAMLATSVISNDYRRHHNGRQVTTTFLQRAPGKEAAFRALLPLYPAAFRRMRLPDADLIIISSSGFAHHAALGASAPVLVYCHTPPRFLWRAGQYFGDRRLARAVAGPVLARLRRLDREAARAPQQYLANSRTTAERIERIYERDAPVVYPPVNVERFRPDGDRDDFYLVVSRLLDYKRVDLAVAACSRLGRRLIVIGDGPSAGRLREMAGPTVEFLGSQGDDVVTDLMQRCRAFFFPGEEDFGISPVEAMAAGAPVIAFNRAGATETVLDGETGMLFPEQTVDSVIRAVEQLEAGTWPADRNRARAEDFRPERFAEGIRRHADALLARREGSRAEPAVEERDSTGDPLERPL